MSKLVGANAKPVVVVVNDRTCFSSSDQCNGKCSDGIEEVVGLQMRRVVGVVAGQF